MTESGGQGIDVIELHQPRGLLMMHGVGMDPAAGDHPLLSVQLHLRFVDAAVIVPIERDDLVPTRDHSAQADDEPVGVGGGGGHLPVGQAESSSKFLTRPYRVLCG